MLKKIVDMYEASKTLRQSWHIWVWTQTEMLQIFNARKTNEWKKILRKQTFLFFLWFFDDLLVQKFG